MQETWRANDREDANRIRFIAIVTIAWVAFFLMGCAPRVLTAPSLGASMASNVKIKKNVTSAEQDINQVLKDNAIIARPDLTADLRDADTQLLAANNTIDLQAADLHDKQKAIDQVTAQGNEAIAAKLAMEPKHKRDIEGLFGAWLLASLACVIGPLVFKAYPALVFFPTSLEAVVCSFAAFLICSGIASLLILFGVL